MSITDRKLHRTVPHMEIYLCCEIQFCIMRHCSDYTAEDVHTGARPTYSSNQQPATGAIFSTFTGKVVEPTPWCDQILSLCPWPCRLPKQVIPRVYKSIMIPRRTHDNKCLLSLNNPFKCICKKKKKLSCADIHKASSHIFYCVEPQVWGICGIQLCICAVSLSWK